MYQYFIKNTIGLLAKTRFILKKKLFYSLENTNSQ